MLLEFLVDFKKFNKLEACFFFRTLFSRERLSNCEALDDFIRVKVVSFRKNTSHLQRFTVNFTR